ncbi:MAG: PepSY-like domain-containing protein [Bacteroidales bacterium]
MKAFLLILVTVLSINCAYSQKIKESEVPAPVTAKFQLLHPDIKDVNWLKHKKGSYEAEFTQNKSEFGVSIDSLGNLKETEMEMRVSELSKEIHEYVAKNYPDYRITEASQITYAEGKPMYEAEITKGKDKFDLLFDNSFKFVKKGHF